MKKVIIVLLSILMVIGLSSCKKQEIADMERNAVVKKIDYKKYIPKYGMPREIEEFKLFRKLTGQ